MTRWTQVEEQRRELADRRRVYLHTAVADMQRQVCEAGYVSLQELWGCPEMQALRDALEGS